MVRSIRESDPYLAEEEANLEAEEEAAAARQDFSPEPEAGASVGDYGEADFEPSAETTTGDR